MGNLVSRLTVQLIDQISGPAKGAGGSLKGLKGDLDKLASASGTGKMAKAVKQVVKDIDALESIGNFKNLRRGLTEASQAYKRASQEARRLAAEVAASGTATRQQEQALHRAVAAADSAKAAFMQQGQAVRSAMGGLQGAGIAVNSLASAESRLRSSIEGTTGALNRQAAAAARSQKRREAAGVIGAAAGVYTAQKAKDVGKQAIVSAADYDYAVRRQRAFASIKEEDQQQVLAPQARRIATDTKFSNIDVVEAQTTVANRLAEELKTGAVIAPIIDQVKNYALSMKGVDMDQSAEAVTGFLLSTGKDISTKEKAAAEARRATNMLMRMSKLGGMHHEDIMPLVERGMSAGRLSGLKDETMGALAIALKRSNISGDQAGTALRTIASKLVAPTQKGQAALASAGIDYDSFTKMPGAGLSVENLEKKFKQDFGKAFTPEIRKNLQEVLSDSETVGNRGAFIQAVQAEVEDLFGKTKKGEMKPADAAKIAKKVGEFHKFSVENVDAEGLLNAILSKDPSLGVLNAFATDKHGNKVGLIAKALEQYQKDRATLANTPADFGDKISAEITGGLGGAFERLKGSVENIILSLGTANEKLLTPAFDKIGNAIDAVAGLPEPIRQAGTALGLLAAGAAGTLGSLRLISALLGIGGPSAALSGSAAALTQSAAALNAAAVRLGVGGAAGTGVGSATAAAGTGWLARGASLLRGSLYAVLAGAAVEVALDQRERNLKRFEGIKPGEQHNLARKQWAEGNRNRLLKGRADDDFPVINQTGAKAQDRDSSASVTVDTAGIDKAKQEATAGGQHIEKALGVTGKPDVDTSSIAAAEAMVDRLKGKILGLGSAASGVSTNLRRTFADIGVSE
jgi:hypothetical protein